MVGEGKHADQIPNSFFFYSRDLLSLISVHVNIECVVVVRVIAICNEAHNPR